MRPTFRTIHSLLALPILALVLAGCGGGEGPLAPAVEADHEDPLATSLVPVMAPQTYAIDTAELIRNPRFEQRLLSWEAVTGDAAIVGSELRAGGNALRASGKVTQPLAATLLTPRRSYTLKVRARNLAAGVADIALRFREANGGTYRTFACRVTATSYGECRVEFTAPAYVARAELVLVPQGTATLVDSASMVMRSPLPLTEYVGTLVGSYVPPGYALVFNDEFNGPALNRRKWFTRHVHQNETLDRLNDEQQRYRDNANHVIANGILSLVARKVSDTDPAGIDYESGMLRSDFTFRHGYLEARVRMPAGKGVWPAFWLTADVDANGRIGWPPEIDIFEVVNNGEDDTTDMLHTGVISPSGAPPAPYLYSDAAFNRQWNYWRAPFGFDDGWHTVAAEWTPEGVSTYVDGRKIVTRGYAWTFADGTPAGDAHVLLNLAVGGAWAGRYGIDDSALPQALQINWIRVYQKSAN